MPELVVATMNLKCRAAHYDHRARLLLDALAGLNADVVALQEDCVPPDGKSQAEELAAALAERTGRPHHVARGSTHEAMWHGILFDEGVSVISAHPLARTKVIALPSHSFHRRAVIVDVEVPGAPLRFCSTHLDFGEDNDPVRAAALKVIYDEMKDAQHAVVAGDMNATPQTRAILAICDSLVDLWSRAKPDDPGYTFPANDPDRRIDYLLCSRALADGVQAAWLIAENDGEMWLSDHLGVAARIRVAT